MKLPHTLRLAAYVGLVMLGVGTATTNVTEPTYSPKNVPGAALHCITCPPGHRVFKHCTVLLTHSECQQCPDRYFSNTPNGNTTCTECFPRDCPRKSAEEQACTPLTDRECLCDEGHHRHPIDPIDRIFECLQHATCKAGQGELHDGNHTHNRLCETCEEGKTFLTAREPDRPVCQPCTLCADGTHETTPCSLQSDTHCTPDSLGGGAITVIVLGIFWISFVIAGVIATVKFYNWTKRRNYTLKTRHEVWLAVGVVCGVGLPVVWCVRKKVRRDIMDGPAETVENGAAACSESGRPLVSPSDSSHNTEKRPSGSGSTKMEAMLPRGDSRNGQAAVVHETAGVNGSGPAKDSPAMASWSTDFIHREVFLTLSQDMGLDWERLIRALPGWPAQKTQAVIDQKKLENPDSVREKIHSCLNEWTKRCPGHVTEACICQALRAIENMELIDSLRQKHADFLARTNATV